MKPIDPLVALRRLRSGVALCAALLLAACGGGSGGGTAPSPPPSAKAWQTAAPIELLNADSALQPRVAMNAAGAAVAVWAQSDGVRLNILANRYTPGSGWGGVELISDNATGSAFSPRVGIDASGKAVAVWVQEDQVNGSLRANMVARRFNGVQWEIAELIELDNAGDATNPELSVDAKGNAVAVWSQADGPSSAASTRTNIWANRYVAEVGWESAQLIESNSAGNAQLPKVSLSASGHAFAVWEQASGTPTTARIDVWANHFDGTKWVGAKPIESNDEDAARRPQVASDANGNAIAVWLQQAELGITQDVVASRFTPVGDWGAPTLVETGATGNASGEPRIAMDVVGNAMVVWAIADGSRTNIRANRYLANTGWATAEMVETQTAGDAFGPEVAVDGAGNATVVWQQTDESQGAENARRDMWANRYTPGAGWGTAEPIETNDAGDVNGTASVAMDASGNAVAVWAQLTAPIGDPTGRQDVWANVFK